MEAGRQRTPHPNLVPSLYSKTMSDVSSSEGKGVGARGHIRFEIAHDGIEEWRRSCGMEVWVGWVKT